MSLTSYKVCLLIIILLAAVLRLVLPTAVPPSLNWDEASLGYNAYSILKTGKDEWGKSFPLSFEAFGDYKLPGYIYTAVPFVAIFGLNEWSVRIPSELAGVLSVLLIYLIVKQLSGDRKWALVASFLMAISPWSVFLSRVALEANLALCFFLFGFYFFLLGLKRTTFFTLSSIFFGLSLFTYNSARIFIPIFLLGMVFVFRKQLTPKFKNLIVPIIVFAAFLISSSLLAFFQDSSARYYWIQIVDQGAINYLNESRTNSPLPDLITKLIYNRYTYFIENFIKNYLTHFSLEYLFLKGGTHYQFSLQNHGLLYLIELPFLILGLIRIWKFKQIAILLIIWVLAAPIASAITREAPHVLRSIFMLGALQIIAAFGIISGLEILKHYRIIIRRLFIVGVATIFIILVFSYLYQYFIIDPRVHSQAWQYGMKDVYQRLKVYSPQETYITKAYGEPHIFYLFFNQYDPRAYQGNPTLIRYANDNWRWVDKIDNINFVNDWEVKEKLESKKGILITSPDNYPKGGRIIDSIYFLNGNKAFDIVEL